MTDKVEIANRALFKVGSEPIVSFTDNCKAARLVNQIWDSLRRDELADHPWSFSIKRASLPALLAAPVYGFKYQYQKPSDALRIVELGDEWVWTGFATMTQYNSNRPRLYVMEGDKIQTDHAAPLNLRYVFDETNTGNWAPQFVEAFACRLAIELCVPLTESDSRTERLRGEYEGIVRKAMSTNAIENGPLVLADNSWMLARL